MAKKSKTGKTENIRKSKNISIKQEEVSQTNFREMLKKIFFKLLKWLLFLVLLWIFLIYYNLSLDKIFERDLLSACEIKYSFGNLRFSNLILSLATIFILIYSFRRFLIKKPLFAERIKNKITRLCCNILIVIFINLLSIMILPSLSYFFFSLVQHILNISFVVCKFHFSSLILSLATIFILIYSFRRFLIKKPLFAERIKNKITRLCCNILMVIFINLLSIMILPSLSYLFFSLVKHTLNISLCTSFRYSSSLMKPIIYLYPTEATDVSVKLGAPEKLSHTYPKYAEGWDIRVEPNGNLTDMATRRHYYALYWEGKQANLPQYDDGFVVAKNEIAPFLEEKLALLGLNEREANEFIIYWLPKLESAPYTFIHFVSRKEQNRYMPLEVKPAADTVIRVLMAFKNLDKPIDVREQVLSPAPARNGFTVIEWGGTEIGSYNVH